MYVDRRIQEGVSVLAVLAAGLAGSAPRVPEIAATLGLTIDRASELLADAATADLVKPTTSRAGGFVLTRPAEEIAVADIFHALDPSEPELDMVLNHAPHADIHPAPEVWTALDASILLCLHELSLRDMTAPEHPIEAVGHPAFNQVWIGAGV